MEKTVVTEFVQDGGLANQMFEFAAGRGIAKTLGLPHQWVWLPSSKRKFGLGAFGIKKNRPPGYDVVMEKAGQGGMHLVEAACKLIKESKSAYPAVSCPFQAEECFANVADEMREIFKIEPLELNVPPGRTPVAVQVRKTDYAQHPRLDVVAPAYFKKAMEFMREKLKDPHFFFTSDDLAWCRQNFRNLPDVTIMRKHTEFDGLRMMAACKAHIISNSTYGWWGAWLAEDGPVVAPDKWHMVPGSYGPWKPVPDRWHRVGGTKVDTLRPQVDIKPFKSAEQLPRLERAIVYPWKAGSATWQELRYSLRSIDEFFEDKECPIYILGTERPGFLLYGDHRVKHIDIWGYWEALALGVQLAEKVLWMNDDVVLLKDTSWDDCAVPYHLGDIQKDFLDKVLPQNNPWRAGAVQALKMLKSKGIDDHKVYSTHLPYVYERDKMVPLLEEFGVWDKMPAELLYFHTHPEGSTLLNGEKATDENFGDAMFLNYVDKTLTPELKAAIMGHLPNFSPWELKCKFPC